MTAKVSLLYAALLSFCGISSSCNNSSSTTNAGDTAKINQAARDSINKVQEDSIAEAKILDTIKQKGIVRLDPSTLSCDSIAKLLAQFGKISAQDYIDLTIEATRCNQVAANKNDPNNPQGVVVHTESGNKILFNTISLKTGEDIAKAAKVVVAIVAAVETDGSPQAVAGATLAGNYAVESYLTAAKNNDPLLIIAPGAIPGAQLAKDGYNISQSVFKEAVKLDFDKPITIQVDAAKKIYAFSQTAVDEASRLGIPIIKIPVGGKIFTVPSPVPPIIKVGPVPVPSPIPIPIPIHVKLPKVKL